MENRLVRTPDGVDIAIQEHGKADAPAIVFIHGFSQCHLSWTNQIASPLADSFRLVTYDIRGHGASGKPEDANCYTEGRRWADELSCVFDALQLTRPLVGAWSYAGRILADYLAAYGPARLAGINLVASKTRSDPSFVGPEKIGRASCRERV